jgi:hypothetical protein
VFDAAGDKCFLDFVHFNERGHALVASVLQPAILKALRLENTDDGSQGDGTR